MRSSVPPHKRRPDSHFPTLHDLHIGFSRGRLGGLVFPSLEEFSCLYIHLPTSLWIWKCKIITSHVLDGRTLSNHLIWSSIQFSCWVMSNSLWPHGRQHTCPSPTPRVYSNSCSLSRWSHPTISSSVIPFSSCLQSFPASGSFPMSQFFVSGGQSSWFEVATW